jgi:beta-glucosidase
MGLPGQEGGNGITDVLFGDVNPSGRLPFTMAKSTSDYSTSIATGSGIVQIPYSEGLFIDYFHFDSVR